MERVRDCMSSPAVTVRISTPADDVFKLFDRGYSAVPVLDEEGGLAGVLSTTDAIRSMVSRTPRTLAGDLMSAPAIIATPDEDLDLVAWRLVAARAHRLVVVEHDRPVGILSTTDLLAGLGDRRVEDPIRSIMSRPVESISLGDSISDAIARLAASGVHALVVMDGLAAVGSFGHPEALAVRRFPASLLEDPVEEVLCRDVVTIDSETPIHRAAADASKTKARRILVTAKGQLVGIVSDLDLVDALARGAVAA